MNLNITLRRGECTAIVGPSGGGKSSIVNLLLDFYKPNSGSILWDGIDSSLLHPWSMRQNIGFVSQEPVLFSDTIRNNILYGWRADLPATDEDVLRAAKVRLPFGQKEYIELG